MRRALRGSVLSLKDIRKNLVISKIRAPIERSYAVIKRIFNGGHVLVTTERRAHLKNLFWAFSYNLVQLGTLRRRGFW
jgi:transposase, IS5 family